MRVCVNKEMQYNIWNKESPRLATQVLDNSSGDWKQSWKPRCSRFEKTAAAKRAHTESIAKHCATNPRGAAQSAL